MLHFGKRDANYDNSAQMTEALRQLDDLVKRAGQNRMLHFGEYRNSTTESQRNLKYEEQLCSALQIR